MSGERSIVDRLGEAVWRGQLRGRHGDARWSGVGERSRDDFCATAAFLLAALPSVGLILTRNDGGEG